MRQFIQALFVQDQQFGRVVLTTSRYVHGISEALKCDGKETLLNLDKEGRQTLLETFSFSNKIK